MATKKNGPLAARFSAADLTENPSFVAWRELDNSLSGPLFKHTHKAAAQRLNDGAAEATISLGTSAEPDAM
jgi:hypothetical protein